LVNALEHGGVASPAVEISASDISGRVVIEVFDNGRGLDEALRLRVFEMFFRGPALRAEAPEDTDLAPGRGVGLAIVKRIIDRHGGEVWVESDPHRHQTRFKFSLKPAPLLPPGP
ncbi:MAG: ATP-binding protein, partial [Pseudomonadota bacterium]